MSKNFKEARVVSKKEVYVEFYYSTRDNPKKIRVRKRCNHVQGRSEQISFANKLCLEINVKLNAGWTPDLDKKFKSLITIEEAVNKFLIHKATLDYDSLRTYKNKSNTFLKWIQDKSYGSDEIKYFSSNTAIEYLDYINTRRSIGSVTYNNYLRFQKILFNWFVSRNYIEVNPFLKFPRKKAMPKERVVIPPSTRELINNYYAVHSPGMQAMCYLAFFSLLRPKEITFLKPGHIDLKKNCIILRPYETKSKKTAYVTIPTALHQLLSEMNLKSIPENYYLFSTNFRPGAVQIKRKAISHNFLRMRQQLGLPVQMKFYSLRDTGIIQLLENGVSPIQVQKHARHSCLSITNIYVNIAARPSDDQVRVLAGNF